MLEAHRGPERRPEPEDAAEHWTESAEERIATIEGELEAVKAEVLDIREQHEEVLEELKNYREQLEAAEQEAGILTQEGTDDATAAVAPREGELSREERAELLRAVTDRALTEAFPGRKFTILSAEGSSCNVYEGDDGLIYKVGVQKGGKEERYDFDELAASETMARRGDYMADEAEKLRMLHEKGLGPKMVRYVNSRAAAAKRPWYKKLLRTEETAALPILVMEKVDFDPDGFAKLSKEDREKEAERITAILEEAGGRWVPGDTEPVVDKRTGQVTFVDAGGWLDNKGLKKKRDVREKVRDILELKKKA